MNILQRLYASEINTRIKTFWDCGFMLKLGDPMNGYKDETTVQTLEEVEEWLTSAARRHFPTSEFARSCARRVALRAARRGSTS